MALSTPTTADLRNSIVDQLGASLGQSIPLLPKSWTRVLAKAVAGVAVLLYRYGGAIHQSQFVATASADELTINGRKLRPLAEWGRLFGVGDPIDATAAELTVQLTVTNADGSTLAAGAQLVRKETGVVYATAKPVVLDGGTVQVDVQAVSDQSGGAGLGAVGNLEPGDALQLANPLPNIARDAAVTAVLAEGAEAETPDEYRARVARRVQRQPQGGARADYQAWAESVPGVAHAYPYTSPTPGYVDVYIEADAELGDEDGIPSATLRAAVADAIELDEDGLATRRPATARVIIKPIVREAFRVEVHDLVADDEATVKAAIEAGVDEHLRSLEPFIVGLSVLPRRDQVTQGKLAGIVHEIANAEGATVGAVVLKNEPGNQINVYTPPAGRRVKLWSGGIEWV